MKKFNSVTGEVKYLVMEYMEKEGGKEAERKSIVEYVNTHMDEKPSDGVVAGAIKILVASGELVVVNRGCYAKGIKKPAAGSFEKIYNVCSKFLADFEKACTLNILSLTEGEKTVYPEISEVLERGQSEISCFMEELKAVIEKIKTETEESPAHEVESPVLQNEDSTAVSEESASVPESGASAAEGSRVQTDETNGFVGNGTSDLEGGSTEKTMIAPEAEETAEKRKKSGRK